MRRIDMVAALAVVGGMLSACAKADTYVITLDEQAAADSAAVSPPAMGDFGQAAEGLSGRLLVFFITETGPRWQRMQPRQAPFFGAPQPIASVEVKNLRPGQTIEIAHDAFEASWPRDLGTVAGPVRVQALLDIDRTERSHNAGPGNVYSDVVEATLAADGADRIELVLKSVVKKLEPPATDHVNLRWVELRSDLLSAFYGRDVVMRAGVALPLQYFEKKYPQRSWPAIYEIPGFGGTHFGAAEYAEMFARPGIEAVAPMAVTIVLDPESPLGHHGFMDSPNHGPRGTALVTELIPHLEKEFRLVPKPEARIVTGHSSGGWSSLWLALQWPEVFGACWSTSPDPIDFSAFQMTDLYADASMYEMADGADTPSYREISGPRGETTVRMTVRQEAMMEWALHPRGGSGEQWDTWEAMFSPRNPEHAVSGLPQEMFDPLTGAIDREVVEHWRRFDITRLVEADWPKYGPVVMNNVRLACGELDSFYLNRAVERFKTIVEAKRGDAQGAGYVLMVPLADHGNLREHIFTRINEEMRAHLRAHGLHPW